MGMSFLGKLAITPIVELGIGDTKLRRRLSRAGYGSIIDVFSLSEDEIDSVFDWNDADAIIKLKESFQKNPEKFALAALQKNEVDLDRIDRILSENKRCAATQKTTSRSIQRTKAQAVVSDGPASLPPQPFSDSLCDFETRAISAFDSLADRFDNVMVYQAFEEFSGELDEIGNSFQLLFGYYKIQPRYALSLIDRYFGNAFAVFVADRARSLYDGGNLWGNLFEEVGIEDVNAQALFKQIFVNQLDRRSMPLYARDEETNHYFYTALLHGGLSEDSWEDLWQKSLLPLAKEIAEGDYGFGGEMDGHSILKMIKNQGGKYAPKKSVLNILEKAPDATIAPLFEASLRVALQVASAKKSDSECTMITSFGLPDVAMQALGANDADEDNFGSRASSPSRRRKNSPKLVYLPMADLQLDLAMGKVFLRWGKRQFPMSFAHCRIDYYIDGHLALSKAFAMGVGKCILDAAEISVVPQERYDVELRLMEKEEGSDTWMQKSVLEQSFSRNKPGCFEFVRDSNGVYRLRDRKERIRGMRRVAYLVKRGLYIVPGQGMKTVAEYETDGEWEGRQIFLFDVESGASGAIVDEATREEVAVWQEQYLAKVDKRRIIGETEDGLDLYGFVPCGLGTNGGLPSVSVEAFDGMAALDDLAIVCFCDGERVSVPRRILWEDEYGDSSAARIALVPAESTMFGWHVECCTIEARQKSAGGKVVFRYRFAIVPIQEFRPASIEFELGTAIADYRFQAKQSIVVTNSQGDAQELGPWSYYTSRMLLKDEFLHVRIKSVESGKTTDAKLALAALDIELSRRLVDISKKRPICLADVLELGPSEGNVKLTAFGWRYNRAVLVLMGYIPMFYREFRRPGEHSFNVFACAKHFVQAHDSASQTKRLKLSVCYGDDVSQSFLKPAWCDVELITCEEGCGFSSWRVLAKADGSHEISFDEAPLCDMHIDFKRKIGNSVIAEIEVLSGQKEVAIPIPVIRLLDARKKLTMTIAPADWFGNPQYEYATDFTFSR